MAEKKDTGPRKPMKLTTLLPDDPIYQQGWATFITLGELRRRLRAERDAEKPPPKEEA